MPARARYVWSKSGLARQTGSERPDRHAKYDRHARYQILCVDYTTLMLPLQQPACNGLHTRTEQCSCVHPSICAHKYIKVLVQYHPGVEDLELLMSASPCLVSDIVCILFGIVLHMADKWLTSRKELT